MGNKVNSRGLRYSGLTSPFLSSPFFFKSFWSTWFTIQFLIGLHANNIPTLFLPSKCPLSFTIASSLPPLLPSPTPTHLVSSICRQVLRFCCLWPFVIPLTMFPYNPYMKDIIMYVFLSWLNSPSIIFPSSIHVVINYMFSCFLMAT